MKRTKLRSVLSDLWQPTAMTLLAAVAIGSLLFYQLSTLVPLMSGELNATTKSLSGIFSDPLFIHQQLLQKIAYLISGNQLLSIRTPSVLTGIITVLAFYSVVSTWFTRRIAIFSSLLLTTSSWFLHLARLGTTDAAYLLALASVMAAVWLHSRRQIGLAAISFVVIGLFLLYVPGMLWFVVPALVWQRAIIVHILRRMHRWQIAIAFTLLLLGISPLIAAIARDPNFILRILALPESLQALYGIPERIIRTLSDIFILRQPDERYGIGRIPYLSIFSTAMVALGVYAAFYNRRLDRIKLLLGLLLGGTLLAAASTNFSIAFLLPPLFLLAAGGIALLLQQWFTVFPKNPFARQLGVIIVLASILLNVVLGLTRYFIAWPHTPETSRAFNTQNET